MFATKNARRVTIIVDAALQEQFVEKIMQLGANGYNVTPCRGKGLHAITGDGFTADDLVRIEIITSDDVGKNILNYIHATQFSQFGRYALTAFADRVEVDMRDKSLR